jgi:hypothetical protein
MPRAVRRLLKLLRWFCFDLVGLSIVYVIYQFAVVDISTSRGSLTLTDWKWIPLVSAGVMSLQFILTAAEAVFSYAKMGSYGRAFHGALKYKSTEASSTFLQEVYAFAGMAILGVVTAAASLYMLYFLAGSVILGLDSPSLVHIPANFFTCFYFASLSFALASQPEITDRYGQLLVLLISFQGASLVLLMLTTLTSAIPVNAESGIRGARSVETSDHTVDLPSSGYRRGRNWEARRHWTLCAMVLTVLLELGVACMKRKRSRTAEIRSSQPGALNSTAPGIRATRQGRQGVR